MNLEENPLLGRSGLPKYDLIKAEHVVPAVKKVLAESERKFVELEKTCLPTWEGLFEPLAEISLLIHHAWSPVTHLNGVLNSEALRSAFEEVQGDVVTLGLKMYQSERIYKVMKEIQNGTEFEKLTTGQKRVLESRINDAELSGIGLSGQDRETFNELAQELTVLSTQFANNVLDATKEFSLILKVPEEVFGLPVSYLNMASQSFKEKFPGEKSSAEKGPWLITLDYPSFVPFMENSKNRKLREDLYLAFIKRASREPFDNRETIKKILKIRKKQSKLLGFSSYAEMSLSRKMADSVEDIFKLEEELLEASWTVAKQELEELRNLAKENGETDVLHWDIAFWAKRLQEKKFQFSDEDLRPYFPLPRVLDGLFDLVHKLFGITVKASDGEASVWHKDVKFFKIFDRDQNHIASFFLDPYSRPQNKRGGAWMDECLPRYRKKNGELVLPVAYLVCNSTPPVDDAPSLMTFREVETLFHEFGHGLQHMLTKIDIVDASGINGIEWDAIELPSQFMENWCYHQATLMGIAKHYKTDESMPEALFEKLVASKTFRAGQLMLRQIQFGLLDLELHHNFDPFGEKSPFDLQREIAKKTSLLPSLPQDFFLCSFSHIFSGGYAAGYYSYKWAEVLSADAFSAFEEVGLENDKKLEEVGEQFRETILALGGSQHPLEVFKMFRKRAPSTKALLKHSGLLQE